MANTGNGAAVNPRLFHNGKVQLYAGDCMEVLGQFPVNSIDAVVTDPPYGLKFMGRHWDHSENIAFTIELWAEVLRVLKPGGHMVCFGGTRTYHRMAVAIEDAGFEVRDQLAWVFGSGFPKNHAVSRSPMFCQCGATGRNGESIGRAQSQHGHNGKQAASADDVLLSEDAPHLIDREPDCLADYPQDYGSHDEQLRPVSGDGQAFPPSLQYAQEHTHSCAHDGGQRRESSHNPSLAQYTSRLSNRDFARLENCENGLPRNTSENTLPSDTSESQSHIPDSCQGFSFAEHGSGFPVCQVCGKPNADGYGTALKPSFEPICLARKPLSENTVAGNVLRWGTSALNIDGCRIPGPVEADRLSAIGSGQGRETANANGVAFGSGLGGVKAAPHISGRWPANLCHDGSPEVLAGFPETGASPKTVTRGPSDSGHGSSNRSGKIQEWPCHGDSGSAARFFASFPQEEPAKQGRWPANLVHDGSEEVLVGFPDVHGAGSARDAIRQAAPSGIFPLPGDGNRFGDSGSAARFFYTAKAGQWDRINRIIETVEIEWNTGQEQCLATLLVDTEQLHRKGIVVSASDIGNEWNTFLSGSNITVLCRRASKCTIKTATSSTTTSQTWSWLTRLLTNESIQAVNYETANGSSHAETAATSGPSLIITLGETVSLPGASRAASGTQLKISASAKPHGHPTIKPVKLMQWLVRLVCPKGATVLDPFAGTGTTGAAAFIEGRQCVLIEREAEYLADIERRMELLLSGQDERSWKLAKPESLEALPLFALTKPAA